MIRINFLDTRPVLGRRLQTALQPEGPAFLGKRELALACVFLTLALVILATQLRFEEAGAEPAATTSLELAREPKAAAPAALAAADEATASGREGALGLGRGGSASNSEEIVATASSTPPPPPPSQRRPLRAAEPAAKPGAVSGIRVNADDEAVQVLLSTRQTGEVHWFRLEDPPRIAFDFAGARLAINRSKLSQPVGHALLTRVRAAQNTVDPPKVRVVLDVRNDPRLEVDSRPDGVLIRLTDEQ